MSGDLFNDGWRLFPADDATRAWANAALPAAQAAMAEGEWLHGGTWFPGVDALPNEADGSICGVPLAGPGPEAARALLSGDVAWHRAQVSACRPGYPRQDVSESDAAHRYRRDRAAAHVDGLLPIGPERRRMVREPHAFVLGLPLAGSGPSPLVIWEGSHHILREAFAKVLRNHPADAWRDVDLTETYAAARRHCFETCRRIDIASEPGTAYLVHRLTLHGVAPWSGSQTDPRIVAYLRPEGAHITDWLDAP